MAVRPSRMEWTLLRRGEPSADGGGNANLSERLQEVKMENKALRERSMDHERVRRAFGPEEVEKVVEDTKRQEAEEKEQRNAKRKFSRGVR